MRSRLTKAVSAVTLVAALAVGGATFASASSKAPKPAKTPPAVAKKAPAKAPASAGDTDNIQQGDRALRTFRARVRAARSPRASRPRSRPASRDTEVPGNDGPGGHADEPGNPNADHQFDGAEKLPAPN